MVERVASDVFEGEGSATVLWGGKSRRDGRYIFPYRTGDEGESFDRVPLAREGNLWSFTVQRVRPKSPYNGRGDEKSFEPFVVGYVELPGQLIVETRIVADPAKLEIGQRMRVGTENFRDGARGEPVLTYAFYPMEAGESVL